LKTIADLACTLQQQLECAASERANVGAARVLPRIARATAGARQIIASWLAGHALRRDPHPRRGARLRGCGL